jgi:hypothetical protein
MGGKTGTTTSSVAIPPEVLARYNSVNAQAQNTAGTPFKQYSTDPSAFVAPLNQEQNAGISGINTYANAAQPGYQAGMNTTGFAINQINAGQNVANPYYGAATGLTGAAAAQTAMNANAAQPAYQAGYGAANNAQDVINAGQNVAQPYFQGAQTMAAGTVPQYQQASNLANAAMTPLQQATYAAQPGYQAAQAGTMAAGAGTGQTIGQIGNISQGYNAPNYQAGVAGYMNPFLQNAMGSTAAMMQNQNRQQQNQLQGNAISSGAFGGDRGNIAQAALMGQQNLAMGQTLGQMANTGYQSAAQNYMSGLGQQGALAGQQGAMYGQLGNLANQYGQLGGQSQQALINAGQAQQQGAANIANIAGQGMNAAGQYGQLGAAAQNAALQGAGLNQQQANLYGQLGTGAQNAAMQGAQQLGALGAQYGQLGTAAQNAALQGVPMSLAAGAQQGQLGAGAQAAGLQGAQAQVGAGTLGQQTTQAGQSALYNQFQQQQAYPFQVSQFLANIAEGTGALSGSTTTQTAPQSFFSDARLKEDIKRVGTAHNGLPIYTFKYKGDNAEQTHIGYMAQDVEKVHPEAVGESHGFKTVDYDKASEPAHKYAGGVVGNSEGGAVMPQHMGQGFAVGGDVVSPTDLSALIAQQQQSYAPFQQAGIYGGQSGGTPHGGAAGVVPAGNLHVSKLQPAQISNTEDTGLMSDVERAENIGDRLTKMQGYASKVMGQPARVARAATGNTPAQEAQPATGVQGVAEWAKQFFPQGQAHGGVVGYASGGGVSPYETDDPMSQVVSDTEKDKNQHGLMTAQNPTGQPSSTFGDLSKIVNAGETAATIGSGISQALPFILAPFGLATGGRAKFEDGGDTTPDDIMGKYAPAIANIESSGNYAALGPVTKTGDRAFGKYQVMGANVPSWTKEATGKEMTPDEFLSNPEAQDATFKHHFGKALSQYGNPQDAASVWFSGKPQAAAGNASDINGTTVPSYLKKFNESIGNADMPAENAAPAQAAGNGQQSFQVPEGDQQQPSALKGIGDALSGNEHLIIPLLSGIGAMAGSKSRYLGSAILEGIGAGANAYENVQNNIVQRNLTNAQKDVQSTLAAGNAQTIAQNAFFKGPDGQTYAMTPQGPMLQGLWTQALAQGKYIPTVSYDQMLQMIAKISGAQPLSPNGSAQPSDPNAPRPTQAVPGMPTGNEPAPPPNPYTGVGHAGNAAFDSTYQQSFLDQPTFQTKKAISDQAEVAALAASRAAQAQGGTLNQLASTILKTNPNSWNAIGVNNEYTNNVANYWNDMVSRLGGGMGATAEQLKGWKLVPEDVGSKQAADKISGMLQFAQLNSNDTHSLGALQTAGRVIPSTANSYEGAVDILSGLYADKQKAIDQNNYINEYKKLATQKGSPVFANRYLVQDALQAFPNDHSDNQYGTEKERLKKILATRTPDGGSLWDKLYSSGKPDTILDEKLPGMGRYLRNN